MPDEVSEQNHGGRPRKWTSDAERMAAKRQEARAQTEQERRDEEWVQAELAITRAQYEHLPMGERSTTAFAERMERSEEYLRKWVAGEIGPRSR